MITLDQIFDLRNKDIYIHCVTGLRSVVPITQVTGAGFRVFNLGSTLGPWAQKHPGLVSMFCHCHLDILNNFWTTGHICSFCSWSDKLDSWSQGQHKVIFCVCAWSLSHVQLCDSMGCSASGSSVHGILQTGILEWVAISFSRISSPLRDQALVSCIAGRFFTFWATREASFKKIDEETVRPDELAKGQVSSRARVWTPISDARAHAA